MKESVHFRMWFCSRACDGETGHGLGDLTSNFEAVTCSQCILKMEKTYKDAEEFKRKHYPEPDPLRFHKRVDELICGWTILTGHSFTEDELNSLVDLIGDELKRKLSNDHPTQVR